jgi:hypothetical protein
MDFEAINVSTIIVSNFTSFDSERKGAAQNLAYPDRFGADFHLQEGTTEKPLAAMILNLEPPIRSVTTFWVPLKASPTMIYYPGYLIEYINNPLPQRHWSEPHGGFTMSQY